MTDLADLEETCDGRHPQIRHDGSMIYLYDLVAHPGCPHQPWAGLTNTTQVDAAAMRDARPVVPDDVIEAIDLAGRRMLEIGLSMIPESSPFREIQPKALPPTRCCDAAFGRVHYTADCRC